MHRRTFLAAAAAGGLVGPLAGCLSDGEPPDGSSSDDRPSEEPQIDGGTLIDDESNGSDGGDTNRSDGDVSEFDLEYPLARYDLETLTYDPADTHAEVEIGSEAFADDFYHPHELRIWNQAGVPAIELRITDTMTGSVFHDERHEIPADEELRVSLAALSEYRYEVRVPEFDVAQRFSVPCFLFDCNESWTEIGAFSGGELRSTQGSTLVGCQSYCDDHPQLDIEAYVESAE